MYRLLEEGEEILPTDQFYDLKYGWRFCEYIGLIGKGNCDPLPIRRKIDGAIVEAIQLCHEMKMYSEHYRFCGYMLDNFFSEAKHIAVQHPLGE